MVVLNLIEEVRKAELYRLHKTYVFVQTSTNLFNGYILEVHKQSFIFLDDEIPQSFPISFLSLKAPLVPSKKIKRDLK